MTLRERDRLFTVSRLPRDVRDLLKERRLFVGGGFVRETIAGQQPHDIDVFGPDAETLMNAASALALSRGGRLHETSNAYTVLAHPRTPVQFIRRWLYDDAQKLIESFDFTVCQAVLWYDLASGWKTLAGADFYSDLAARRLVYTAPKREEAPGGSLLRARKFIARGYSIQADSLAGVVARIVRGVRDPERMDESQLAHVLSGLIREVDPSLAMDGDEVLDEHAVAPLLVLKTAE